MSTESARPGWSGFPLRLLPAAIVISLLASGIDAWLSWQLQERLGDLRTRQFHLTEYVSRVMLFDEVLTMSARMAAATGDAAYKRRYDRFDAELDALLKETKRAFHQPIMKQFIGQTSEANRKLVRTERQAFALTFEKNRPADASALLTGDDYLNSKKVYADGVNKAVALERAAIRGEERTVRFLAAIFQISSGVVIAALLLMWFFALRAGRRWSQERLQSEADLRRAHDELERRVKERTADLEIANAKLQRGTEALTREIEERKRVQEQLATASIIVENSPVVLGRWRFPASGLGPEGPLLEYLSTNFGQFGYRAEELLSGSVNFFREIVHPDDRERIIASLSKAIAGRLQEVVDEFRLVRKDGETRWVEGQLRLEQDAANGTTFGRGTLRDITERERAEEALRQSEARFRAIFDNARDGIALADSATRQFLTCNDSFCEMLGYAPNEMMGLTIDAIHPADAWPTVMDAFEQQARGKTNLAAGLPIKRKDGSIFFADINSAPVMLDGKTYLVGIFRDVSERKAADDKIRFANTLLEAEIESSPDGVFVVRADRPVASFNRNFLDMWSIPPDIARTHNSEILLASVLPKLKNPDAFRHDITRLQQHLEMSVRHEIEFKDGRILEYHAGAIKRRSSGPLGRIWFFRDITERKLAAQRLEQRDVLLHAVALSATELVTAPNLDDAIRKSLESVSKAIHADRMIVLESPSNSGRPILRYRWESSTIGARLDAALFETQGHGSAEIAAWTAPLKEGKFIVTDVRQTTGDVKRLFEQLDIRKNLVVPIMVDGKYWGQIGFDSCDQERTWADFEIEILQTLAELIGTAIQRDRYVKEIADANRIVQNTPTILYRMRGEPAMPMIYVSQNIKLFGYEPAALIESPHLLGSLVHPGDIAAVRESQAHALNGQRGVVEFRLLTSRGNYRWVENRYTPISDAAGRLIEIEGLLIDITERKAAEEKIALLARTDSLTGLANRTTFIDRLRQSFAASRRGAPAFALHYLDLDRFKDINDTLGHPLGDRFLVEIAKRLRKGLREVDLAARLGGDEFAVLQMDLSDTSDAGTLATKIRAALSEPLEIDRNVLRITASIGIAVYAADTTTPDDMLAQADLALYRAKEEGRDQYRFHTQELDFQVRERVAIAEELRTAIKRDEFELYYQPQVEVSTNQIVGMEALIRWNHPTRGMLLPSEFLAVAERTGAVSAIGQWVLDRACQQMSQWRKNGIAPPTIAVNASVAEIKTGSEFVDAVTETLEKWALAPADLELDVTESMLARATLAQSDVLERLQKIGVKISIDDFGTKYSSLDYLKTYRVSRLKIPQPLINSAIRDPDSAAMVRAIVGIARELNIEVIAQGVENASQWSFLTATSPVTKVQGFFYSEPVPADRAEELLQRGRIAPFMQERASMSVDAAKR